jgi:hypothetical protein
MHNDAKYLFKVEEEFSKFITRKKKANAIDFRGANSQKFHF